MTETVTVRIGGEDIALPLILNLAALKRTDPALKQFIEAETDLQRVCAAVAFISALLLKTRPDLTPPKIEDLVRVQKYDPSSDHTPVDLDERPALLASVVNIWKASGMIPQRPPETPAAAASPSTATGTTSSPS